ncbi:MAG: M23 family metallopeptidase [Lachnospiraceae bacterium]|nr:M23 family metallopeptidase [Lachnospiraceae bacterium]
MDKLKRFFSTKGFYVALCTGVFAFAALMVAQDFNEVNEVKKEQAIDLNEPAEDTEEPEKVVQSKEVEEKEDSQVEITNSDSAVATTEESTEEIPANSDSTIPQESTTAPEIVFNEEESLVWPLIGNVILPYSMDTTVYFQTLDAYKCNPGILIQGEEGASVVAAAEGIVAEIKDTKEYGTVIIVDMGSGYMATYGQLMNITVGEGEHVMTSQELGEVGPVSAYYREEGNHVYFAITKDGEEVDPMSMIQ